MTINIIGLTKLRSTPLRMLNGNIGFDFLFSFCAGMTQGFKFLLFCPSFEVNSSHAESPELVKMAHRVL